MRHFIDIKKKRFISMKLTKRIYVHFKRSTAALENRNFKYFISGQVVSHIGFWINTVAMSWLVYRLTGSAALLGLVTFTSQFPAFLLAPFAGVQVDRLNKKKVLQVTIALSALQSLTLAILCFGNAITVTQIILLGVVQSIIDAFYIPARQAFIPELVNNKQSLPNAIALNASSFHFARLVGPMIGGILVLIVGEGGCFLIDSISYIGVLFSLSQINTSTLSPSRRTQTILQDLSDGVNYIKENYRVRILITYVSFICLLGITHTVLLPVVTKEIFSGSSKLLGVLMGCSGFGSLCGAIYLAVKNSEANLLSRMRLCGLLFGLMQIVFALSPYQLISMISLFICGFCFITIAAGSNTLIQSVVPDHYRGRIMSFFTMSFTGMMPIGSIGSGWIADQIGVMNTYILSGVFIGIGAIWFLTVSVLEMLEK
jgi:MFS family permease